MNAKDFLATLSREHLERVYAEVASRRYTREADEQVAAFLPIQARVQGHDLTISGPTLGRYRSDIGLVSKRSARAAATTIDPDGAPSVEQLQLAGFGDAEAVALLRDLLSEVRQIKGILCGKKKEEAHQLERPQLRAVAGGDQ